MKIEHPPFEPVTPVPASPSTSHLHFPYRPDIDGLRAIAVLCVVIFHAFPSLLPGGFIGVDVFFVISGFLITSIILQDLDKGRFSFATFYARRVKRIFPALILVLVSSLAFGWLALFPDEYKQLGKHVAGGSGFIANFLYWAEVGYFDTAAETKPMLHLWSLGIEEQFYIVWPLVLAAAWRLGAPLRWLIAGLALISFLLNARGVTHHASATFYLPITRAWELLFGAWLAWRSMRAIQLIANPRIGNATALAGLALLALGCAFISQGAHFPGWRALLPVVGAALIIAAGGSWLNRKLLSNRLMVGIGLISYPLYLWHWPLLSFARVVEGETPALKLRIAMVVAALVLAWLTYRLVELPLRRKAARYTTAGLSIVLLAVAGSALAIYHFQGLPARATIQENYANQKGLVLVEDTANAAACKARYKFDTIYKYCLLASVERDPTVALVGDSHAYHLVAGMTRHYSALGENLLLLGTRVPYWNLPAGVDDHYQAATQPMLELALSTPSIKTVIFSSSIRFSNASPATQAIVEAARDTLRRFTAAGKHVIFMDDIPHLNFDPRSCLARPGVASSATRSPCAVPIAEVNKANGQHPEIVAGLMREFPMVEYFATAPFLCDQAYCHAILDGKLMYRDTHHLTYEGDLYMARQFAARPKKLKKHPRI